MKTITVDGLKLKVDPNAFMDIEVLDTIGSIPNEDDPEEVFGRLVGIKKLLVACYGDAQYKQIYNKLKAESGHVTPDAAIAFLAQTVEVLGEKK